MLVIIASSGIHFEYDIKILDDKYVLHGLAKIHAFIRNCYNIGREPKARD